MKFYHRSLTYSFLVIRFSSLSISPFLSVVGDWILGWEVSQSTSGRVQSSRALSADWVG